MAQVSGIELLQGTEDAAGRSALGVGRLDAAAGVLDVHLFDATTYGFLGTIEGGTVLSDRAVPESAFVDEPTQRPGGGGDAA